MENDLPPDVDALFKGAETRVKTMEAARASKGSPSLLTQAVEAKDQGYLPEMVAAGTALGAAKYLTGKTKAVYLEELKRVRGAVDKEAKLVKSLRTGAQPFEAKGVKVTNQNKPAVQATRKLKSGNIALKPYETGAASQVSSVRGASNPKPVLRAGFSGVAAQPAVQSGAAWLAKPAVEGKAAIPPFLDRSVSALKPTEQAKLAKELTKARMTRYLPFIGEPYAPMASPLNDVRAEGVSTRGKGATRTNITVKASDVKAGKANIPPKGAAAAAASKELNFAQKALRMGGNVLSSPWVQRPLMVADVGTKLYGMPQRYRDEVALMEAERNGAPSSASVLRKVLGSDSAIRPYIASGAAIPRMAANFYTGYVPEMVGMYDMPEDLGNMYKNFAERDQSEFIKKTGRPMTEEEQAAQQEAMWMSTIGFGG
jgi:hypothetical protein